MTGSRLCRGAAGHRLEEQCEAAHSVAFKNTILTAACVTGSLLNFCDLFMSGGTSREDHSEVGSGVIHFNFDPRGDKWGSLLGDARGVLLRSAPVFVGGQAGIVGPAHIDFGAVVAAGSIVRRDVPADCVHFEQARAQTIKGFDREVYPSVRRKFLSTARLIGNLRALAAWYRLVRLPFADGDQAPLYEAAEEQAWRHVRERVKRLEAIVLKLERSLSKSTLCEREHRPLIANASRVRRLLLDRRDGKVPDDFVREYEQARAKMKHLDAVRAVSDAASASAAAWLAAVAAEPVAGLSAVFAD